MTTSEKINSIPIPFAGHTDAYRDGFREALSAAAELAKGSAMTEDEIRKRVSAAFCLYGKDWNDAAREIFALCCELAGIDRRTAGEKAAEVFFRCKDDALFTIGTGVSPIACGVWDDPSSEKYVALMRRELAALIDAEIAKAAK